MSEIINNEKLLAKVLGIEGSKIEKVFYNISLENFTIEYRISQLPHPKG